MVTKEKQNNAKTQRILVVEDEPALLAVLTEEFREEGYDILSARNGVEGIQLALKERPDLILLDLIMPHMDGLSMLSKLRADSWGKGAHVLVLTNLEGDAHKTIETIEHGVFEYLVKSRWSLEDIKRHVVAKLASQRA